MMTASTAPLSFGQHRIWAMEQLVPGASANLVMAVRLTGPLNIAALAQAFTDVVRRHEVLRSAIRVIDGQPVQQVVSGSGVRPRLVDLRSLGEVAARERAEQLLAGEADRPFDPADPPLLRLGVLLLPGKAHIVVVAMHHAITDGWSMGRLAEEISALYADLLSGRPVPLRSAPTVQFGEHARRERARDWSGESASWLDGLDESAGMLPVGRTTGRRREGRAAVWTGSIPPTTTNRINDLLRAEGGTLFMLVLSAWVAIAHRLDGRRSVLTGTLASGRTSPDVESSIGYFANVIPIGATVRPDLPFRRLWHQVRQACLAAYEHQDIPFEVLSRSLPGAGRPAAADPFSVLCVVQPPAPQLALTGLRATPVDVPHQGAQFALTIEFREQSGALRFGLQYDRSVLDRDTVALLGGYLRSVLEDVASDVDVPCGRLRLGGATTAAAVPISRPPTGSSAATLHEHFEALARRSPDAVALSQGAHAWSYGWLNRRANQLARALRSRGIGVEDRVAVCLPHGADTVAALIAILKSGAAYVPVDPAYPADRVGQMLADASVRCVVSSAETSMPLSAAFGAGPQLLLDRDAAEIEAQATTDLRLPATGAQLAYIIYTSGSTGRPKGVLGHHDGTLHRLRWMWREYPFQPGERTCQRAPLGFVDSVWEIFGPLLAGVPAEILVAADLAQPARLLTALARARCSRIVLVPSLLRPLLEAAEEAESFELPAIWVTSGERLPASLAERFHAVMPGRRLLNLYGCTEVAADATAAEIPPEARVITIGKPIAATTATVIDSDGSPQPPLVSGQLVVGGPLVARGYHNAPGATADRFRPDPVALEAGARAYWTGDLARTLADGQVEYLGRADGQLKVRGVRIEPAEVEEQLLRRPSVRQAAVTAVAEETGDDLLVALVVPDEGCDLSLLRSGLADSLPPALVPAMILPVQALPLNPSGKVDRRELPALARDQGAMRRSGTPAERPSELLVSQVFTELLPVAPRFTEDDFFALGGHSLIATVLLHRLHRLSGVRLRLRDLFSASTVGALARLIDTRAAAGPDEVDGGPQLVARPERLHEPFPLTEVQQAYWVGRASDLVLGNVATHAYFEIDTPGVDVAALEEAVNRLVRRHPALRTVVLDSGQQQVLAGVPRYHIHVHDLAGAVAAKVEAELLQVRETMSHQVLSAQRWPLFELRVSRWAPDQARVHVSIDALVADAYSVQLLTAELARCYADPSTQLPPLRLSFRDLVVAQEEAKAGAAYQGSLAYWRERLPSLPTGPDLPLARSPETLARPRFRRWAHRLETDLWRSFADRAAKASVTPSVALLTAFAEVLTTWSRQSHFTVMLTLFNRGGDHPDLYQVVGDFTSVTPLEVDHREEGSFAVRARAVQQRMWADLDHSAVGGITVLREWAQHRGGRPGLLAPVVFTSNLGLPETSDPGGTALGEIGFGVTQTPQAYLDHQVAEAADGLVLHWDAIADLFPPGLIDAMFTAYIGLITGLADGSRPWEQPVLGLLPPAQRQQRAVVNDTSTAPRDCTLPQLFAESARRWPDAPAVISSAHRLTYRELADRAARIGHGLRARGIGPGDLVGVAARKGWQQAVAVLAITGAGAAYVPLDPDLPAQRFRLLVEQTGMRLILTESAVAAVLPDTGGIGQVAVDDSGMWTGPAALPPDEARPDALAYVIFTSGSTGVPKGVMIDHRGAVNTILDMNERFGVGPADRVLGLSALSFDLSVYDLFGVWAAGGAVVLPDDGKVRDPRHWLHLVGREQVTIWNTVPALLDLAVDYAEGTGADGLGGLRTVWLSGDWIPVGLPDRLRVLAPGAEVVSLGGATEASIWSVYYRIGRVDPEWTSIPYGRPLANQNTYVLDDRYEPRPDWVPGDLYLAGSGLALGYWADPEKTARHFVRHPRTGERLYRTGDLARWRPDGQLEFLGRADDQVKISGFRIELGEVEAALRALPGVTGCAVAAVGPRFGNRRLAAFYVDEPVSPVPQEEALQRLRESLPAYLVPTTVTRLAELPLTRQGKVDRAELARLAERGNGEPQNVPTPPPDALLAKLGKVWEHVLGVERVGPDDNFFQLGGTSLVAVRLVGRLEAETGVKLSLVSLYDTPTVRGLAEAIVRGQRVPAGAPPGPPAAALRPDPERRHEAFPLTAIQEAYWLGRRSSLVLGGVATHSYVELDVAGLDVGRLEQAVNRLIERHEALRTVVLPDGTQRVLPDLPSYRIERYDVQQQGQQILQQTRARMSHRVYDTRRWPLFEVAVSRLDADTSRVHISVDLIVADALSFQILQRELLAFYHDDNAALPVPDCTFRDYVLTVGAGGVAGRSESERYWRGRLAELPDAPPLPLARQLSEISRPRFERLETRLGPAMATALSDEAAARNLTPSGLLCAGYAEVLAMWAQTSRFTINLTTFNRQPVHPDIEAVVGDFTSTTLLAVEATGENFTARAQAVQAQIFRDLEHREVSGVEVLRMLRSEARRSAALAPVVFTSTLLPADARASAVAAPAWPAKTVYSISQTPQVLLDFQVYAHDGGLVLVWDHVADAFPEGMLSEMFDAYQRLLRSLVIDGGYWEVGPGWTR